MTLGEYGFNELPKTVIYPLLELYFPKSMGGHQQKPELSSKMFRQLEISFRQILQHLLFAISRNKWHCPFIKRIKLA